MCVSIDEIRVVTSDEKSCYSVNSKQDKKGLSCLVVRDE